MQFKRIKINTQPSDGSLKFLYATVFGRIILKVLTRPFVSKAVGTFMNSRLSKRMIAKSVKNFKIDLSEYKNTEYKCYNDFFTREIKPENRPFSEGLVSPCDAKLTAYKISDQSVFNIKGSEYALADILDNRSLAEKFKGGTCLIFRLCVDDYHRYAYFDDATEFSHRFIKGVLHTVQPIAFLNNKVFYRNSREYTVLSTEHYGEAIQIEVGALCVGKINNHHKSGKHKKGEEKGMFLFGGSTIIVLLNGVKILREITENTECGYETVVKMGDKIGE